MVRVGVTAAMVASVCGVAFLLPALAGESATDVYLALWVVAVCVCAARRQWIWCVLGVVFVLPAFVGAVIPRRYSRPGWRTIGRPE